MTTVSLTSPLSTVQTPQAAKAIRLIDTKLINREQWLSVRQQGIGSSDAAAAIGLNPYQSQLALWLEKTGRATQAQPDSDDDSSPMYWGTVLEPIVAQHYSKRTDNKVRRVNAVLQHPSEPFMLANLDREIVGNADVQVLECKTAGIHGAKLWADGVPEYMQVQVMHQLAVTGKRAADVAVLIAGQELRVYRIERDEQMIANLIELERQFWHYVETDTAPPADGSDSAETALCCLFPHDNGETIDFSHDADLNHVFEDLLAIRQTLKANEAQESLLRQRIEQEMGNASTAQFQSGMVTWKRSKDSLVLDTAKLNAEQPALVAQYQTQRAGSRRFVLSGKVS